MKASTIFQRLAPLLPVILSGCVLELLYLLLIALSLIATPHLILSPSGPDWPWVLAPAQLPIHNVLSLDLRYTGPGFYLLLLGLIFIALAGVYVFSIGKANHAGHNVRTTSSLLVTSTHNYADGPAAHLEGRRRRGHPTPRQGTSSPAPHIYEQISGLVLLPLIGATIFGITLFFLPTLFSNELYSYFLKGFALLSHLINCMLIWAILSKLALARRLGGTLLYAWNPLALIELVGNGHFEGLLICLFLLATWLYVQQKSGWYDFGAVILLGLAISMNGIGLLLAPLFTWFSVRSKQSAIHTIWGYCWRALIALTIPFILYLPFWQGRSIFLVINSSIDMQHFAHSPLGVLVIPVRWLYSLLVPGLNEPATISSYFLHPTTAADMSVLASAMFIFVLIYFYLLGRARSIDALLTSLCLAILGYVVLVSGQFWPWYVLWALWIVALRPYDTLTVSVLLLSCTALLTYPLLSIGNVPIAIYQPLLIFGIPLVYLIAGMNKSNERKPQLYDRRSEAAKN